MSFDRRLVSQSDLSLGSATIVSATYTPVNLDGRIELIIDSNVYGAIRDGGVPILAEISALREHGHRINPLASLLEERISNQDRFVGNYSAFRANCAFDDDYEELPLGGREEQAVTFFGSWHAFELGALKCYVLFFALLLKRERDLDRGFNAIREFLLHQMLAFPAIGILFHICLHVKRLRSQFNQTRELALIEKFFALPQDLSDASILRWANNLASDLYLPFIATKVSLGNSHLGGRLDGGVAIATSDKFVADVLFRYMCASEKEGVMFSFDLDELVQLDPNLFDVLPNPGELWAAAKEGFKTPTLTRLFYSELWSKLMVDAKR